MPITLKADQSSGVEGSQLQFLEFKLFAGGRVTGEKHLEASVQFEPLHNISPNSTSYGIPRLQQGHLQPCSNKVTVFSNDMRCTSWDSAFDL
jgi:hypothetical protein